MKLLVCVLSLLLLGKRPAQELRMLGCIEPICSQHTSYYNEQTDLIEVFVSRPLTMFEIESGMKMCVTINDDPAKHCYADEHGRVQVDLSSSKYQAEGTLNVAFAENVIKVRQSVLLPNGSFVQHQDVESHFIMPIPKDDTLKKERLDPSFLAYTKVTYPNFGSIVSRKLVLDYEANEVAKNEALYILFNIDGVYETQIDAAVGTLMTFENNHTSNIIGAGYRSNDADDFVQGVHVEPSSWFFKLQPALSSEFLQAGGLSYPSFGYLEWVLERHIILMTRVFGHLKDPSRRLTRGGTTNDCMLMSGTDSAHDGESDGAPVTDMHVTDIATDEPSGEEQEPVRVCMWTSSTMDGQKRIWLRQLENMSLPPYSHWNGSNAASPLKFVVFLSSESLVAPDLGDSAQVELYRRLVEEHRQQGSGIGTAATPVLDSLNEYETRLLDMKLGSTGRDDKDDRSNIEVVRAPTLGAAIGRERLSESFDGHPSPLATNSSVETVLHFIQERFRTHTRGLKADGAYEDRENGDGAHYNSSVGPEPGPRSLDTLKPLWVREVYQRMATLFLENRCSLSVHGNLRGFNADFLITDTARYLGIPTVSELLNLFVDPDTASDVVVGPSWYSLEHESMRQLREGVVKTGNPSNIANRGNGECLVQHSIPLHALPPLESSLHAARAQQRRGGRRRRRNQTRALSSTTMAVSAAAPREVLRLARHRDETHSHSAIATTTDLYRHSCGPLTTVISPAVDTDKFSPWPPSRENLVRFPGCVPDDVDESTLDARSINSGCFIVGFVARLSNEKNPGLFVQMAASLLGMQEQQQQQQDRSDRGRKVRFLVLGDGHLKHKLVELARRAGLIHCFSFVGWVSAAQLPSFLRIMDVVVNPSVRAWSETFCIANIEVMSMETPLVTFGAGGVGEYIDISTDQERDLCRLTMNARAAARASNGESVCSVNSSSSCERDFAPGVQEGSADDFTVAKNAVLVHSAHPVSLAGAVMHLFDNTSARASISSNGRKTVVEFFQPDAQLWKYTDLYRFLANATSKRRKKIFQLITTP